MPGFGDQAVKLTRAVHDGPKNAPKAAGKKSCDLAQIPVSHETPLRRGGTC